MKSDELKRKKLEYNINRYIGESTETENYEVPELEERKPNGYWKDLGNVIRECKRIIAQEERIPSQGWLRKNGHGSLTQAIASFGGMHKIREILGEKSPERPKKYWNDNKALETYQQLTEELGHPPIARELYNKEMGGLADYIYKRMGGIKAVQERLCQETNRKANHYWTLENTLQKCRELVDKLGHFPTQRELQDNKRADLAGAIQKHGGLRKLKVMFGFELDTKPNNYWNKENTLREARDLVEEIGYLPNSNELSAMNKSSLSCAIIKNFRFPEIRRVLGLEVKRAGKDFWTEERILEECKKIVEEFGDLPSSKKLKEIGYKKLGFQIQRKGGFSFFRRKLGLGQNSNPANYWNEENTLKEAKKIFGKKGYLPSQIELYKIGMSSLAAAITKNFGYERLRLVLGDKIKKRKDGLLNNLEYITNELKRVIEEQGFKELPAESILKKIGYASIVQALYSYHQGYRSFREKFNRNLGISSDKNQLESILDSYIGGEDE